MLPATFGDINRLFSNITNVVLGLVALAALGMLIYGGYRYLSAGSDKQATTLAQKTITYALMGLIICLSAWIILSLIGVFLGVNVSVFDICVTHPSGGTTSCF